jgi:hypothetical protein
MIFFYLVTIYYEKNLRTKINIKLNIKIYYIWVSPRLRNNDD